MPVAVDEALLRRRDPRGRLHGHGGAAHGDRRRQGTVREQICGAVDLAQAAVFDFQAQPCKAISVGIGFTAETAELGGELPVEAPPNPCAEDAAPAGTYDCS